MMQRPGARASVTAGLLLGTALLLGAPRGPEARAATPLRARSASSGVFIGTMLANIGDRYRAEEARGKDVLYRMCSEFNMLTPGNALKFEVVQPAEGKYDWAPADALVTTAWQCGMRVVGTPLVWHEQVPRWVYRYDGKPARVRSILREHITKVMTRYAGRIAVWDVVNEAVLPNGALRNTFWRRNLGPDYVVHAFRWARAADPAAKLYYNDYGNDWFNNKSRSVLRWVKTWRARGAPIDGVGFQAHLTLTSTNWSGMVENLRRYAAVGFATRLSELDVSLPAPATRARLAAQRRVYREAVHACLVPRTGCRMITIWGLSDRFWTDSLWRPRRCCGVLFDASYRPKPAYAGVREALGG